MNKAVEKEVIECLLDECFKRNYVVSVDDGEGWVVRFSNDKNKIMDALFSVDDEFLIIHKDDEGDSWKRVGQVYLVHGNDGYDVIADYSDSVVMRELMVEVDKLVEKYW